MNNIVTVLFLFVSLISFGQKYGHCDVAVVASELPEVAGRPGSLIDDEILSQ